MVKVIMVKWSKKDPKVNYSSINIINILEGTRIYNVYIALGSIPSLAFARLSSRS